MGTVIASETCGAAGTLAVGGVVIGSTGGLALVVIGAAVVIGGLAFGLMKLIEFIQQTVVSRELRKATEHLEAAKTQLEKLQGEVENANCRVQQAAQILELTAGAMKTFSPAKYSDTEFHDVMGQKINAAILKMDTIITSLAPEQPASVASTCKNLVMGTGVIVASTAGAVVLKRMAQ